MLEYLKETMIFRILSSRQLLLFGLMITLHSTIYGQSYLLSKRKVDSMLNESNDILRFNNIYNLSYYFSDRDMDSSRLMLRLLTELTNEKFIDDPNSVAKLNDTRAYHFYIEGKYDSVAKYLYQSIEQHKVAGNLSYLASSYSNLGNLAFDAYLLDSAENLWLKAVDTFYELGDSIDVGSTWMNLGAVNFEKRKYIKATDYKYKALEAFTNGEYFSKVSSILMSIAEDQMIFKQYGESKNILDRAFKVAKANKDLDALRDIYTYYAELSRLTKNLDSTLYYDSMAYQLSIQLGDRRKIFKKRQNLASTYLNNAKTGKAIELSELNLKELINSDEPQDFKRFFTNRIYLLFSKASLEMGRKKEAKQFFDKIDFDVNKNYYVGVLETQLSDLYDVSKQLGLYEESLEYHELLKSHSDSLLQISNTWAISDIQVKYETEKKEKEILNLQQTSNLQDLRIKRQTNYIILAVLGIVILGFGGYSYYRQKQSRMQRAAIELEQKFLRSQLSPHFVFNSMSAIQQYLLQESPQKAVDYLSMFSRLMRQILENSREDFITINEEINMLKNYLELQKIRFQNSFEYNIEIDESLDIDYDGIPPMFAQPFIENALEHGLFKTANNVITIQLKKVSDELIKLEILDSGIGVTGELKKDGHNSLATKITNERLEKMRMTYRTQLNFESENIFADSGEIKGYKVSLTLPSKLVAA